MGPFLFLYSALAGFFACAGLYHLLLWWSSRREHLLGVFSAECFVQAALSVLFVLTATTSSTEFAHAALRVRIGVTMLQWLGWLWCAALVARVSAPSFVWPSTAALVGIFVANLITPLNQDVLSIGRYTMAWGETLSIPQQGPAGWWSGPIFALFFAIVGFGLWCGLRLWRRDRVEGALVLLVCVLEVPILLVPFLRVYFSGWASTPFFGVIASLPWVVVFGLIIARQHRLAEEARRDLESRLAQSQKMEAIGQLASGIAHDFNNLLTVIGGNVEILREGTPRTEPAWPLLDAIHAAGERAAALTRQLLMFTRRQIVEPRLLDLNAVVIETRRMLVRLLGDHVSVQSELGANLAPVKADPGQTSQVLLNLAVNARDAMPSGGVLTITTAMHEVTGRSGDEKGRGAQMAPGRYVVLSVTDTGCGMSDEVQQRIFEPFFTTKEPGKGTGLGLATVRTIVDELNGTVQVSSVVDHGSTFRVFFEAQAGSVAPEVAAVPDTRGAGAATVLVVEDEASVRRLVQRKLTESGYTVLVASSGEEALGIARERRGTIDLVVTDVVMPGLGGRELAEQLRRDDPTLKILFLSGYSADAVLRQGLEHAHLAFLQKPFTMSALAQKVRQTIDRQDG